MKQFWRQLENTINTQKVCNALLTVIEGKRLKMNTAIKYAAAAEQIKENQHNNIALGKAYPGIFLTEREAHCSLLMILGFTSKETAEKMYLSPRTVEHYIANVKKKLKLKRKSDIILALLDSEFVQHVKEIA